MPTVTDKDGRIQPARKATRREISRRQDLALQLWKGGATRKQIAQALDISLDSVGRDLMKMGVPLNQVRLQGLSTDPLPVDWLDSNQPQRLAEGSPLPYQSSVTLAIWATFLRDSLAQHHVNRLSHDAADAEEAGDELWLVEAAKVMQDVITEATRMRQVVIDHSARKRGVREEQAPQLAEVHRIRTRNRRRR